MRLLRHCKLPLALLTLVAISGTAFFLHASQARDHAAQALEHAKREDLTQRAALAREASERAELDLLEQSLRDMEAAGIIGDEHRLDWVDTLNAIRRNRQLFKIDYEIGPQQAAAPILTGPVVPPWQWRMSPMRIQLTALHEGDLLNLLSDLRAQSRPWLHVERCQLQRAQSPRPHGPAAQIQAECQLQWVSAQHEGAKK